MPETTKRCYRCGRDQPLTDFIAKKNSETYDMCSPCLNDILTNGGQRGKKERQLHTATERICYLCRQAKPNDSFTRRSNGTFFSACKACNINVFAQRRRARMLAAEGSFTTEEWLEVLAKHPCYPDCGRQWKEIPVPPNRKSVITRNHVLAISKGGRNDIGNIQPLCYSCNSRKGDR
jgi:5-methylcytosine-specific restriction endonuclease McrA